MLPPLEVNQIGLGHIAFAAQTADNTMIVFMGADPMFTSLGLLLSHTNSLCSVVRNMALLMASVHREDAAFLMELARHGGKEPGDEPFKPFDVKSPITNQSAFKAELSLYETAHMSLCVIDTYKNISNQMPANDSVEKTYKFWQTIWDKLPETVKMSVLYEGNGTVN